MRNGQLLHNHHHPKNSRQFDILHRSDYSLSLYLGNQVRIRWQILPFLSLLWRRNRHHQIDRLHSYMLFRSKYPLSNEFCIQVHIRLQIKGWLAHLRNHQHRVGINYCCMRNRICRHLTIY